MLANNETKDILKVFMSLENRRILLKGNSEKAINQEGVLLNFLAPLMRIGLPLMKNILTPLAKSVAIPLGLTGKVLTTDAYIQKKIYGRG